MNIKDYTLSRLIDIVVDCSKFRYWNETRKQFICARCTPIQRLMVNINELLSEMEAMRYSDYCIALQIVYWHLSTDNMCSKT